MSLRRLLPVGILLAVSAWSVRAPPIDSITRTDIAVQVAADGSLTLTDTFDVSFVSPKHGPYLVARGGSVPVPSW